MGPLLRNPVVVANFKPPAAVVEVPQVHVVDVIQAIAQVMHKHRPSGGGRKAADGPRKNFDWPNVHAVLTEKFGVNSVDERCLRLPRGLGHSIVMCVNSWKDEQQQSRQQMMQECRM